MPSRTTQRTHAGSMQTLLGLGILLIVVILLTLGLDVAHNTTTRTALQSATDAAALAGAAELVLKNVQNVIPPATAESAKQAAIARAASNAADGVPVSADHGVILNPNNLPFFIDPPAPDAATGVSSNNGQCQVGADKSIKNIFAGIFGRPTDIVTVRSIATAYTTVTGLDQNIPFPIAVSLDTHNGHDPGTASNKPLYLSKLGDTIVFYLKEPCANAAWTTYNTGKDSGETAAQVSESARNYINKAIASNLGTNYEENLIPPQSVGEKSASGKTGLDSGINLLGALAATTDLSGTLTGKTIVLPIMAGDYPYWSKDTNGDGTQYSPGAGQTRPLLGFCALKVTKVTYDPANNALQSIKGVLVKALVKGIPGEARPLIDKTVKPADNFQEEDEVALDNLSPGMVHLGTSNLMAVTKPQPDLSTWYHGHSPEGATVAESSSGANDEPAPMDPDIKRLIEEDMATNEENEGINFKKPPDVQGAIAVIPSKNLNKFPVDTVIINPDSDLTINVNFQDEVGLNPGFKILGHNKFGAPCPENAPRYKIFDDKANVVQDWTACAFTVPANKRALIPLKIVIPAHLLPPGEHLVMIHTYDSDTSQGGAKNNTGDPSFFYLDLQNPVCPLND